MNDYKFSDLFVGMKESFKVTITEDMQEGFLNITKDENPMHIDDKYAIQNGYEGKIVYGLLTSSFFSTLAGVYLPGRKCLFHECNVAFPHPVYIGDELNIVGEIKELDEIFKRVIIKAQITNQEGKKVARGKLVVGVRED